MSETRDIRPAELDHGSTVRSCDLCWRPVEQDGFLVVELRAVCPSCLERFNDEAERRFPQYKLNFTIGLCERGLFAAGRADPGSNGLGGRE